MWPEDQKVDTRTNFLHETLYCLCGRTRIREKNFSKMYLGLRVYFCGRTFA
jgi:hypothetical protein